MKHKIRYYDSFTDDFEESKNQNYVLPDSYEWVKTGLLARFLSALIYSIAIVFALFYCRIGLRLRIVGKEKLRKVKGACFLYGNHTQPVGDVFIPALAVFPKRIYTLVSPANYGIPVIGKILPYLGALPIVPTPRAMRSLFEAMKRRLAKGHPIVVFPEAHVWKYYVGIRPFPDSSFHFPVKFGASVFALTATYQKTKWRKKPRLVLYADGPFEGAGETEREKAKSLRDQVENAMKSRAAFSDSCYIEYRKKEP